MVSSIGYGEYAGQSGLTTRGFYTAVILPDGALERTFKVVNQVEAAIRSNPNNQDIIAFTDSASGGGFRNNAATLS
jgi:HAE1 family hydrophobic/amphiphilic exporter-1/multidrug efflux pump